LANLIELAGGQEEFERRRAEMAARYPDEDYVAGKSDHHAIAYELEKLRPGSSLDEDDRLFVRGPRERAVKAGTMGTCLRCGSGFERGVVKVRTGNGAATEELLTHTCRKCREAQLDSVLASENDGDMVYNEAV